MVIIGFYIGEIGIFFVNECGKIRDLFTKSKKHRRKPKRSLIDLNFRANTYWILGDTKVCIV